MLPLDERAGAGLASMYMVTGIIGKKVGTTQTFGKDGVVSPATVIKAGLCVVVQGRRVWRRTGHEAVQIGLAEDRPPASASYWPGTTRRPASRRPAFAGKRTLAKGRIR